MQYYSQYQQDEFINSFLKGKRNGVFVDIGAHDGKSGSNTYFFEKELNWSGICIEPLNGPFKSLQENRSCKLLNCAAWKENTEKVFRSIKGYSEMLSGIVDTYDPRHINRIDIEHNNEKTIIEDIKIKCIDINSILYENKLFNIDFISIDVEGSEYEILNHINYDMFNITLIVAENNYQDINIRKMMESKGYSLLTRLSIDDVFIKDFSKRKNKFKIVIPSYNNEEWVETNFDSINTQTYTNYDVLYINDASTDKTFDKITELTKNNPKWTIVSNETNQRRGYNISPYNSNIINFMKNDSDILVFVDGDDWLAYPSSLEKLNTFYNEKEPWMTYGRFICFTNLELGHPQNTEYSVEVHNNNTYRKDWWRASHLRTFKWWLYKQIQESDIIYSKTGKPYFHAEDLATTYPCLEMCPSNKIGVLDSINYVFNDTPSNRQRGIEREQWAGQELELEIRNKIPYKKII